MKQMEAIITLIKQEADLNQGHVALNADQVNKVLDLLTTCDKLIKAQGQFIEDMKADMFKGKAGSKERSW